MILSFASKRFSLTNSKVIETISHSFRVALCFLSHFHHRGRAHYLFIIFNMFSFCFADAAAETKLYRNLVDILSDRSSLSFFVQYLESKNGLPLVKFWLDLEAFKAIRDGLTRESRNSNYDKCKLKNDGCEYDDGVSVSTTSCSESNIDETEEIQSNGGDEVDHVKTGYDMERMTQSLTDDEKSKICKNLKTLDKLQPTNLEDALRIYRKYLVTDSIYPVELPATILSKLSLALCETEGGEVDSDNLWEAFADAQTHVMEVMEKEFLSDFLDSSFYCKYIVDVLTSESLNLREILYSESALFFFMEFLEQEKDIKLPYLEFWLSATNYRKQNSQLDRSQMKDDALVIYEKWFSLQATSPLNFSNRVRTKVEERICTVDPSISQCFDLPIQIVEAFLDRCCFKKFVKSQLFFKHLSEVMSKTDGGEISSTTNGIIRRNSTLALKFPVKIRHRRTNSDTVEKKGVTRSISAQNTLLAGLDHKKNKNATDLQIDSRHFNDPDLLWRRKNSMNRLSFGRVDAYGRFERDFELPTSSASTIPTSKSFQLQSGSIDVDDPQSLLDLNAQSRFKNVMRRFVHLPDDSIQQDIAWQVAEMIVKDVTNITLNGEIS